MKRKTILLTGGAGFIGSHLAEALLSARHKVIVVDSLDDFYAVSLKRRNLASVSENLSDALKNNFIFIERDILSLRAEEIARCADRVDAVVHLAARAGVRPSIAQPTLYQSVNVVGTQAMLEVARELGVRKFVLGSSSSVYGVNPDVPWSESDCVLQPISPYAASKVAAELLCGVYSHLYGMDCTALRFFTVYGPRQRPDLAIAKFIAKAYANEPIDVYGDGSSARDYTFVGDIVSGVAAALEAEHRGCEIVNLGNNVPVKLTDLIRGVETVTDRELKLRMLPAQPGDVPQTFANIRKARSMLGYAPETNLLEGLKLQARWYLDNKTTDA